MLIRFGGFGGIPFFKSYGQAWIPCSAGLRVCGKSRGARLVFDSFLEPSLAGVRSLHPTPRQLLYESDILVADLLLEGQEDSQRITLTGQVLDTVKRKPQLGGVPIVIQGERGLMGIIKTNQWGEFHFEFAPEPGITLEIKARENFWVSAGLPDLNSVVHCA